MIKKGKEKKLAIAYRKRGLSYNEILRVVPVSKSTLSLWLRSVGLAKKQEQILTEKRRQAQVKAQQARRNKRINDTELIKSAAIRDIGKISRRELMLIGVALYWGEGTKQKDHCVSARVIFSNSDPFMIKVFLIWLKECCRIRSDNITFSIYLHESAIHRARKVREYWSKITACPVSKFGAIYLKKNKLRTKRKNVGESYFGLIKITVTKSTSLNRKISGWIQGIYNNCGVV